MNTYESKMTPIDKDYETCAECYVNLCIYPDHMHPDQISSLLNIKPTEKNIAGTSVINSIGRVREVKISSWFLCSHEYVKSRDLRDHVDWLSSKLNKSINELKHLQATDGIKITLSCIWRPMYGDGGPVLWPKQMKAIADLNLECSVEIYC